MAMATPLLLLLAPGLLAVAGVVDVDISSFGCKPGGAVCTAAFQKAMKQVSSGGGGTIHVRGPGAVVTAGIEMLSDVTLQVHAGASINASTVLRDWGPRKMVFPACATGNEPAELDHGVLGGLFFASLARNFTIRGPGAVSWVAHDVWGEAPSSP